MNIISMVSNIMRLVIFINGFGGFDLILAIWGRMMAKRLKTGNAGTSTCYSACCRKNGRVLRVTAKSNVATGGFSYIHLRGK
jgi:hypothetical protein